MAYQPVMTATSELVVLLHALSDIDARDWVVGAFIPYSI
jgi:hypothetical protein